MITETQVTPSKVETEAEAKRTLAAEYRQILKLQGITEISPYLQAFHAVIRRQFVGLKTGYDNAKLVKDEIDLDATLRKLDDLQRTANNNVPESLRRAIITWVKQHLTRSNQQALRIYDLLTEIH